MGNPPLIFETENDLVLHADLPGITLPHKEVAKPK